jgi:hypothetical protein
MRKERRNSSFLKCRVCNSWRMLSCNSRCSWERPCLGLGFTFRSFDFASASDCVMSRVRNVTSRRNAASVLLTGRRPASGLRSVFEGIHAKRRMGT